MNGCARPHVLVTGASSGIGRATALYLAASGHHVYAAVRKPDDGVALQRDAPGESTPLILDVTDAEQIGAAVETISAHVEDAGLSGLVNNAGIGGLGPLELIPLEAFRRRLEVNVTGQLAVTQAFLPLLRQAGGRIVFTGSIGDRAVLPFLGPLCGSKFALAAMAEAFRQELAPWGVRVVLVEPAAIATEAPSKLAGEPEQFLSESSGAGRALYLVGKGSRPQAVMAKMPAPIGDAISRRVFHQPAPRRRQLRLRRGSASPAASGKGGPPPGRAATPDCTKEKR
jgi:NAD(P)-dependent dehydrogenase (short-subunit alcohol dehydrogenase family)